MRDKHGTLLPPTLDEDENDYSASNLPLDIYHLSTLQLFCTLLKNEKREKLRFKTFLFKRRVYTHPKDKNAKFRDLEPKNENPEIVDDLSLQQNIKNAHAF